MGEFEITVPAGQLLVIADPCYIDRDGVPVPDGLGVALRGEGAWHAFVVTSAEEGWGMRVASLELRKVDGGDPRVFANLGPVAVDSGQMFAGPSGVLPLDYDALLETDAYSDLKEFAGGVISRTGFGDGSYPVEVGYDGRGDAASARVVFIGPDDEEEDVPAE